MKDIIGVISDKINEAIMLIDTDAEKAKTILKDAKKNLAEYTADKVTAAETEG